MDTQAMTLGSKGTPEDIQRQRDAIPPMVKNEMNLLSDALREELKELINEVLDEREWRFK
tara:strand:- start:2758 stop:2937 length:180 start_codon:yes stop_codon:yes gene_type:complete